MTDISPANTLTTDSLPGKDVRPVTWRVNAFGDRVIEEVNGVAFDKLGARATLQSLFGDRLSRPDTLYVVAGSDSGHLIRYVCERTPPPGTRYLFVDPPAIHEVLVDAGLLQGLPDHVRCAPADAWAEAARALQIEEYLYIDGVELAPSLAAQSTDANDYVKLAWELRDTLHALRWQTMAARGAEAFIACQLENAADNVQPAGLWRGVLAGRTGVLLAGGPSLDEALTWVRQHRDGLVVLAVSRISRRLLEARIEPDFVVSVDPTEMSYEISRDMLRFGSSVTFIHQYHVVPRLLGQWPHRSFYLGPLLPWPSSLNPTEPLQGVGPTVTNTALAFAGALGLSRVILAGVDLCFTPEGHTHAQGSNERRAGPRFDLTGLEVETNDGRRASTTADFLSAIQTLGLQVQHWRSHGMEILNPAGGAARIPGVDHRPLPELPTPDQPIARPLRAADECDTPTRRLQHAQRVLRELQRTLGTLDSLSRDLRHARRIVDKLFEADGTIHNRNLRKRLDRLEAELGERYPDLSALIRRCSTHALLRAMKSTRDIESLDAAAVREALAAYYDAYLDGADRLRGMLQRGIDKARLRMREYDGSTPLRALAPKWVAQREAGRFMRWQRNRSTAPASPEEAQTLNDLRAVWEADLGRHDGQHMARVRAQADLRAARIRLEDLFAQGKADGIRGVMAGLEQVPDPTAAAPYLSLARGLLAELQGHIDDALGHYDAVLQTDQRHLWPTALQRVAAWALQHGHAEHARQSLECLAALAPRYRMPYADLLAATGDITGAINVYEAHLAEHPSDTHALARLARLLLNAGAQEAASVVIEHMKRLPGGDTLAASLHQLVHGQPEAT